MAGDDKQETSSALFILTSLTNHSCTPNAIWRSYGDLMVLRARADIPRGAEVFLPYGSGQGEEGKRALSKHFAKGCDCELCTLDKLDGVVKVRQRERLVREQYDKLKALVRTAVVEKERIVPSTLRLVEAYISALESTYLPSRGPLRPNLEAAYHLLAELLTASFDPKDLDKAVETQLKAIEAQGGVVERIYPAAGSSRGRRQPVEIVPRAAPVGDSVFAVMGMLTNAGRCKMAGRRAEGVLWAKAAVAMEDLASGGGREFFDARYEDVLSSMGIAQLFRE